MSESRWKHWSSGSEERKLGFNIFMEGRAADEAKKAGLVADYYGRWMDPESGEVVAKTVNDRLQYIQPEGQDPQPDMGNPTNPASGMKPADRARSLGLQSDGSGGYVDGEGNVVARTVNNELVFYDSRAGGGAVSDGGGGQAMVQSAPSWKDPVSGIIIVPPAKPETPYETAAVPDPVPATAPMGFDSFLDKKRREMYADEQQGNPYDMISDRFAEKTAAGRESGDEARMGTISIGDEKMAEYQDEISEIIGEIPEEEREAFVKRLITNFIRQAKNLYADQVGEGRDPKNEYHSDPIGYARREIDKVAPRIEQESFEDAIGDEDIEGEFTNWTFDIGEVQNYEGTEPSRYAAIGESEALDDPAIRKANRGYGVTSKGGYGGQVISFDWRVKDEVAGDVPERGGLRQAADGVDRSAVAMDAFKVWRNKILPNIPVGTVVKANPEAYRDELKRVYSLAGFGTPDQRYPSEMEGIVYLDANGKKKVYPTWGDDAVWDGVDSRLDPKTGERLETDEEGYILKDGKRTWDPDGDRIAEMYIAMLDTDLNTEEELMVAEILFG